MKGSTYFNPFPNKPLFLQVGSTSLFENTVEKWDFADNERFLFFPQWFLWKTFHSIQTLSFPEVLKVGIVW